MFIMIDDEKKLKFIFFGHLDQVQPEKTFTKAKSFGPNNGVHELVYFL